MSENSANEIIVKGTYYVDEPSNYKGKWKEYFGNDNPIYIEIGMGKGKFIIEHVRFLSAGFGSILLSLRNGT